jgi:uncharacterized protein GlcG (DUF336 family)
MAGSESQASIALTMEQALQMIQGAVAHARQHQYRMSFAVVDAHGNLIAAVRMDGARFLTPETARAKAYASAAYGRPSGLLGIEYQTNPSFWGSLGSLGRPIVPSQGAVPVLANRVLVGAMGAGGGTSEQDEETVRAGIAAAGFST